MIVFCLESAAVSREQLDTLFAALPDGRRARATAARHPISRRNIILGYALVRYALRQILSYDLAGDLPLTDRGKPYLPNREGYFSLSHTDHLLAVAVGRQDLGLDLERVRPLSPSLVARFCSQAEQALFSGEEDAVSLWTKKEAVVKREGTGIGQDLRAISVDDTETLRIYLPPPAGEHVLSVSPKEEIRLLHITSRDLLSSLPPA